MRERDKRKKAQEVFEETTYIFSPQQTTYEQQYPGIDFTVDVQESGEGVRNQNQAFSYDKNEIGQFIDCSNPRCYKGGVDIGRKIYAMVRERKTKLEFSEGCRGKEASPKGRRIHGDCPNRFKVKISIHYKELHPTT